MSDLSLTHLRLIVTTMTSFAFRSNHAVPGAAEHSYRGATAGVTGAGEDAAAGAERHSERNGFGLWWLAGSIVAAIVAIAAHAYFLGWSSPFGLFGNGIDTVVYRHGGDVVLHAQGLYDFALFDVGLPFTYPPFAALAFTPLALVAVPTAVTLVQWVNLALIYVVVVASWRALRYRGTSLYVVSAGMAIAFTWLEPVRMTIWLGQINLLLLVLVLLDLMRPQGSRLRGIGVGIAAGLKLTPAFFVLHLLTLRQWRSAVVAVVAFAATVVLGLLVIPSDAWQFWTSKMTDSDRIGALASPANQSIHGALARAWPDHSPPFALWLVLAGVVAVLGLWIAARAHRGGNTLLALSICGLTTPMVSPFSWGHHWVWCVPLTIVALDYARRRRTWWSVLAPIAVTTPMIAWYFTGFADVKAIGIFMFQGSPAFMTSVQLAYPAMFLGTLVVTFVAQQSKARARVDGSGRM